MARQGIQTINGECGHVGHVSSDNSDTPQIQHVMERRNVRDDCAHEVLLVALVFKFLADGVWRLPGLREESNSLRKKLDALRYRFLFRMAQIVGGAMRMMHG